MPKFFTLDVLHCLTKHFSVFAIQFGKPCKVSRPKHEFGSSIAVCSFCKDARLFLRYISIKYILLFQIVVNWQQSLKQSKFINFISATFTVLLKVLYAA